LKEEASRNTTNRNIKNTSLKLNIDDLQKREACNGLGHNGSKEGDEDDN